MTKSALGLAVVLAASFAVTTGVACPVHQASSLAADGPPASPLGWFTNYGNYMPRIHCLRLADGSPDWLWIALLIGLTATIVVGYLRIYYFWLKCYYAERPENRNEKLGQLANVFLLCATTGYVLSIVMFFWPAYRLMALVFVGLVAVTGSFVWNLKPFELTFSAVRLLRERDVAQAELAERNHSMHMVFDNVGQGLLTVGADGRMSVVRSRVLETWFGTAERGELFRDYVVRANATFALSFQLAWETLQEGVLPIEVAIDQMPKRLRLSGRELDFTYQPISVDGAFVSLLVIITDNTAAVHQEQAEAAHREVVAAFGHMLRDPAGAQHFVAEAAQIVASLADESIEDRSAQIRALHTLKGNCASYGLQSVAASCHRLETKLHESGESLSEADRIALAECWSNVADPLQALLGERRGSALEIANEDYAALLDALLGQLPREEIVDFVRAWRFEPTNVSLTRFVEPTRSLARRLGKGDVEVKVVSNGLRLPRDVWSPFWASFTHVVRNAVDHGLETISLKKTISKGRGCIELVTCMREDALVVSVRDNGRGVDWARVRATAEKRGLPAATHADLTAALFCDGFTTKDVVTEISGRGAGLAAVAQAVAALGGRVEVESALGTGTEIRFVFPSAALDFHLDRSRAAHSARSVAA